MYALPLDSHDCKLAEDYRIKLILDLTLKIERLERLMQAARERRAAAESSRSGWPAMQDESLASA